MGRARAIAAQREKGAATARAVRRELDLDILAGNPARGRAGRIAPRLRPAGVKISARQVQRILDALSCASSSCGHDEATIATQEDRPA